MNLRWFKNIFLVILCAVAALSSGCAGPACSLESFPYSTTKFGNAGYFALIDICRHDDIKWDYDPLSQVIVLSAKDKVFKLMIDSDKVLTGGKLLELSAPVLLKDSTVYVPLDLRTYIQKYLLGITEAPLVTQQEVFKPLKVVILDAGHGGKDPGAIGKRGLQEKFVVLDVVCKLKKYLEEKGIKVYLTRSNDTFIPLAERSRIANKRKADLFVSIHANANHSRALEGFEVYYLTQDFNDEERAMGSLSEAPKEIPRKDYCLQTSAVKAILWDMIYSRNRMESVRLAKFISDSVFERMNLNMLGIKEASYNVLRGTKMTAVLVEIGYISNGSGEKKLADASYRTEMAKSIADGILKYKKYADERNK